VYALAVVGYEMLAGAPPFAGPTAQAVLAAHLTTPPKPLTEVRSEVTADLSAAIATALAKAPEARFPSAAEFREALNAAIARPGGQRGIRARLATGVVLVAALVVALVLWLRPKPTGLLDPNLVAVAPFDVLDAKLALWHEGFVDVLSRNLDGAGPIRTVSPSVVVHRWRGRADPASAVDLGRRTGAQWVVFGQLLSTRADSVRVAAALLDARSRRTVAEIELRDVNENLDRMADSLTVALLRQLSRTRPIGAVRLTPLGVTSLPALKAFLQGEQYFRRTDWDSAITAYERAIALDSAFAPALRHLSWSLAWKPGGAQDSLAHAYAFRAGAFNHGLGPRDSMLVLADSLLAALFEFHNDPAWWTHNRRLFATLEAAARRYPDDPEVWFELGDARFHFGYWRGVTQAQALEAFNRSIALDSAFAPAYFHCVALAANLSDRAAGRRYAAAYLARAAKDAYSDGVALAAQLLAPVRATMLDTLPADVLYYAGYLLRRWPDSAETTVRLTRLMLDGRHGSLPFLTDSATKLRSWAMTLASRGHLHEAYGVVGSRVPTLFSELAAFGGVPRDSTSVQFGRWLVQGTAEAASAGLPWWTANGDTVSLLRFIRRSDAQVRTRPPSEGAGATLWLYAAARARAYLALARHDTSEALRRFALLPDSQCGECLSDWDVLVRAQLLAARGEESDALRLVEPERADARTLPVSVVTVLERGRVAERLGDRETALTAYRFVADVWRNADAELRPYVAEAAAALKRLGGEPRP
jgi:serine/threonine-protein kinase